LYLQLTLAAELVGQVITVTEQLLSQLLALQANSTQAQMPLQPVTVKIVMPKWSVHSLETDLEMNLDSHVHVVMDVLQELLPSTQTHAQLALI
jgi:hypothetical protein